MIWADVSRWWCLWFCDIFTSVIRLIHDIVIWQHCSIEWHPNGQDVWDFASLQRYSVSSIYCPCCEENATTQVSEILTKLVWTCNCWCSTNLMIDLTQFTFLPKLSVFYRGSLEVSKTQILMIQSSNMLQPEWTGFHFIMQMFLFQNFKE